MEGHIYAIVQNEFRYLPYTDTEGDVDKRILPPVTKLDKTKPGYLGHSLVHAVVCAVEARYHKKRERCYPPKSMWRGSVNNLIQSMTKRTKIQSFWGIKPIGKVLSDHGIELMVDEGTSHHPAQCGPKYCGVKLESFNSDDKSQYDKLFDEIRENGPIIGLIGISDGFEDWSSKSAKETIYTQFSATANHAVTLIGTSHLDDGSRYLLAQNCYGEEWGDNGVFRMLPKDVDKFVVPIIPDC